MVDSMAEPVVKGTICGLSHLLIFTIILKKFKTWISLIFKIKKQINKIEKKTSAEKNINASSKTTKTYKASLGYFIKNI